MDSSITPSQKTSKNFNKLITKSASSSPLNEIQSLQNDVDRLSQALGLEKRCSPAKTLKVEKEAKHDLELVDLSGVSKRLKTSCHTLAECLMNRDSSTAPLPNPPNSFYQSEVQIFIDSEPHEGSNGSNEMLTEADICKVANKDGKLDPQCKDGALDTLPWIGILTLMTSSIKLSVNFL
ncbi:hypothetical protein BY996DRAFT_6416507 [Phakopsora pachyrhizi]|nr:hypothetical protein BY996DRAFT_6416507 [Phakopsora pachyrhizi]